MLRILGESEPHPNRDLFHICIVSVLLSTLTCNKEKTDIFHIKIFEILVDRCSIMIKVMDQDNNKRLSNIETRKID
jgi:hypothetical protein